MSPEQEGALFRQLLGAAGFDALPAPLQALHLARGRQRYPGQVEVIRGTGWLSRLCAAATRLPPAGRGPVTVEIHVDGACETWTRFIGGRAMRSRMHASDSLLLERLGLVEFGFRLESYDRDITWTVARVRVLGILPLPVGWFRNVTAREYVHEGRYAFDVSASLPLAGLLVRYHGTLRMP